MTSIKDTLVEANRYDDIVELLKGILSIKASPFAVGIYYEYGTVKNTVDAATVKAEAAHLLLSITGTANYADYSFRYLSLYVNNVSNTLLHNYIVDLTHNKTPNSDIDVLRCWCILDNLIVNIECGKDDEEWNWTIPDGWKKYISK